MDKNILRNSAFQFVLLLVAMACVFIIISGIQSSAYIINSILLAGIIALAVFVSLFFWAWLLGAVGAILAVPLTMLILSVLDSFDATRWVVVLMRSSSSSEEHEKKEASGKLKDLWGRVSSSICREDDP